MHKMTLFHKFVAFTTTFHQVTHEMTKEVKTDEVTPVQYRILEYIAVSQPVTLSEISDCMHMSMPNTSREIKKLCEKNLCEKISVDQDRRKQSIRLSQEGQAMMNKAFQRMEDSFWKQLHGLSDQDLEDINHSLDVIMTKVFHTKPSL